MTARDLLALKEKIEQAKTRRAKLEGELERLRKLLKDEVGTDDPDEVKAEIKKLRGQAEKLALQIEQKVAKLKEEIGI